MEPLPRRERHWERLVELNKEPQEDPENPTPQPTSHTESYDSYPRCCPTGPRTRAQNLGSGPCLEQTTTHWAPTVAHLLVCGVGAG